MFERLQKLICQRYPMGAAMRLEHGKCDPQWLAAVRIFLSSSPPGYEATPIGLAHGQKAKALLVCHP